MAGLAFMCRSCVEQSFSSFPAVGKARGAEENGASGERFVFRLGVDGRS
jgi:hypothetical protein